MTSGVLQPGEDCRLDAGDIHHVRLLSEFEAAGVPLDALIAADRAGRISLRYYDELHPPPAPLSGRTYGEFRGERRPEGRAPSGPLRRVRTRRACRGHGPYDDWLDNAYDAWVARPFGLEIGHASIDSGDRRLWLHRQDGALRHVDLLRSCRDVRVRGTDLPDLLDQAEIARDRLNPDQREADRRIYGVDRNTLAGTGPAVVSINGVVASLAVTEFMVLVTGLRKPVGQLTYRADLGVVANP